MARARPLADLLPACLEPAVARQGFSGADILVSWPEIVGEKLAEASQPIRVDWPRRPYPGAPGETATLVLRAESAFALELQHLAPVILERVNAFYGWRCVGRLVLKQGPVRRRGGQAPPPVAELKAEAAGTLARSVAPIAEAPLRDALFRLGTAVLSGGPPRDGEREPTVPQSTRHIGAGSIEGER